MGFEGASQSASHADHHVRLVAAAAQEKSEHRRTAQAAVMPDPRRAAQDALDVIGEQCGSDALPPCGSAREQRERSFRVEKFERARHDRARRNDLELAAKPHASELS